jgi:hypothetical protein
MTAAAVAGNVLDFAAAAVMIGSVWPGSQRGAPGVRLARFVAWACLIAGSALIGNPAGTAVGGAGLALELWDWWRNRRNRRRRRALAALGHKARAVIAGMVERVREAWQPVPEPA